MCDVESLHTQLQFWKPSIHSCVVSFLLFSFSPLSGLFFSDRQINLRQQLLAWFSFYVPTWEPNGDKKFSWECGWKPNGLFNPCICMLHVFDTLVCKMSKTGSEEIQTSTLLNIFLCIKRTKLSDRTVCECRRKRIRSDSSCAAFVVGFGVSSVVSTWSPHVDISVILPSFFLLWASFSHSLSTLCCVSLCFTVFSFPVFQFHISACVIVNAAVFHLAHFIDL